MSQTLRRLAIALIVAGLALLAPITFLAVWASHQFAIGLSPRASMAMIAFAISGAACVAVGTVTLFKSRSA